MRSAPRTVTLFPLYHPAAALYTPSMLQALEDDVARLPALLGREDAVPVALPPEREIPALVGEQLVAAGSAQLGLF